MEQWLNISSPPDTDKKTHEEGVTTHAFNDFLEKRASTIREEPISEQQVVVDFQNPSINSDSNQSNA